MGCGIRVVHWPAREENAGDADRDEYDDSRRRICRTYCLGLCEPPDGKTPDKHAAIIATLKWLDMTSVGNSSFESDCRRVAGRFAAKKIWAKEAVAELSIDGNCSITGCKLEELGPKLGMESIHSPSIYSLVHTIRDAAGDSGLCPGKCFVCVFVRCPISVCVHDGKSLPAPLLSSADSRCSQPSMEELQSPLVSKLRKTCSVMNTRTLWCLGLIHNNLMCLSTY